jgi:hypothetical protein
MTFEVLLSLGDANLIGYVLENAALEVRIRLWDESTRFVRAEGVDLLENDGTWEVDGIVRQPQLDGDSRLGYGILDTSGNATLRFRAESIAL